MAEFIKIGISGCDCPPHRHTHTSHKCLHRIETNDSVNILLKAAENDEGDINEKSEEVVISRPRKLQMLYNLKHDGGYRKKFTLTLVVFWSYVTLGWVVLQIGAALPDLQILVDIELDLASWIFTTWSLGFLAGSMIGGVLYDRFNRLVTMFLCALGAAICSACLPYSGTFPVMIVLRILNGVFCGCTDTGANTIIPSIWGSEGGPYMQALYLSYTLGGIIVPFVTGPFMTKQYVATVSANLNPPNITNDSMRIDGVFEYSYQTNITMDLPENLEDNPLIVTQTNNIHWAFWITCGLLILSAVPFAVMAVIGGFDQKVSRDSKNTGSDSTGSDDDDQVYKNKDCGSTSSKLSFRRKVFVLATVLGVSFFYSASEDSFCDFIITFCIDYLHWDNNSSVTLLSLYWILSCAGGLSGIVLVHVLGTSKLLFISHIAWVLTYLASLIASIYKINLMIWIFMPCSGFFMVQIMPAVISWTEEHICDVTGTISSMIMLAVGSGLAANPKFIGHMMDTYSYNAFPFILFIESFISLLFFTSGYIGRFAFQK